MLPHHWPAWAKAAFSGDSSSCAGGSASAAAAGCTGTSCQVTVDAGAASAGASGTAAFTACVTLDTVSAMPCWNTWAMSFMLTFMSLSVVSVIFCTSSAWIVALSAVVFCSSQNCTVRSSWMRRSTSSGSTVGATHCAGEGIMLRGCVICLRKSNPGTNLLKSKPTALMFICGLLPGRRAATMMDESILHAAAARQPDKPPPRCQSTEWCWRMRRTNQATISTTGITLAPTAASTGMCSASMAGTVLSSLNT